MKLLYRVYPLLAVRPIACCIACVTLINSSIGLPSVQACTTERPGKLVVIVVWAYYHIPVDASNHYAPEPSVVFPTVSMGRSSHSVYHSAFDNPSLVSSPLSLKALHGHREPIDYGIKILRGTQFNSLDSAQANATSKGFSLLSDFASQGTSELTKHLLTLPKTLRLYSKT